MKVYSVIKGILEVDYWIPDFLGKGLGFNGTGLKGHFHRDGYYRARMRWRCYKHEVDPRPETLASSGKQTLHTPPELIPSLYYSVWCLVGDGGMDPYSSPHIFPNT